MAQKRTDTLGSPDLGKNRDLREKRIGQAGIFNFTASDTKEKQEAIGVSSTPAFKVGLRALAASLNIGIAELVRRAIFAVACDPSIIQAPPVNKMEQEFQGTTHSHGGAGRNQGNRKIGPSTPQ